MRIPRIYQSQRFNTGDTVSLDARVSHHIIRVLRLKENSPLIIFNGQGGEFSATIQSISKQTTTVLVGSYSDRTAESPISIHLGQAISRGDKMDYILQKSVELGVSAITPLITLRSEVKLDKDRLEKRLQHWEGVIIHACEQSGRTQIPVLHPPQKLTDWQPNSDLKLILNPHNGQSLKEFPDSISSVALLIGSEGGLDDQEIQALEKQDFLSLKLGPRILRTETASLAIISAIQYRWGDFK